jgi:DNA-binding FadR family transcriptional regulator
MILSVVPPARTKNASPSESWQSAVGKRTYESVVEHGRIVTAIVGGDADTSEQEMRRHMDIHRANFADYVHLLTQALAQV